MQHRLDKELLREKATLFNAYFQDKMTQHIKETDWKLFRRRVPEWRERYLEQQNQTLRALLEQPNQTPTTIFWQVKNFADEQARVLVECFDGHSRSTMERFMLTMYRYRVIARADMDEFSEELQARFERFVDTKPN